MESLQKLEDELAKARKSYAGCGCGVYKTRIAELESKIKAYKEAIKSAEK